MSPEEWWTRLIRSCMAHAGASHEVEKLKAMGIKTSVVSNADPRILKTLDALHILPLLSYPPILSWDVENSKPDRRIYDHALESCGETDRKGVLMVGDELEADYRGARAAGVAARLIRRQGEWSDGAARASDESLEDVEVVRSLYDIIDHIEERNNVS
ncbi:HAD-like domain-containing protein [Dioszegia hungarica]|uniref:HAD-like domain-containing protein n=1 Tax=Dioszegia hungarica TaxID=4972 RepID=A0AA38LXA6_9TREE|nr:HAD-like domain-containing protein [Dioszegia hungarica]KAI9637171.1 HAD-like domain-containing protein [Dioszegia hungarica]